jgi:hypothetical protein
MTTRFKFPNNLMVFVYSTLFLLLPGHLLAQAAPVPIRDPNAVALASRALQGLVGRTALTDISLEANATYIAGSDQEMGPATLVALGNQQSRVTLNLTSGQRQEIRSGIAGVWVGADGAPHAMRSHNNFVDAAWFYPAFTLAALASDPTLAISLVGQDVHNGEPVYHLALSRVVARKDPNVVALIQHISAVDLYLDASTLLPAALDFNVHPDKNTGIDIPVEVRYAAYQSFDGVQAPTRIQKYVQNSLTLDLTVTIVAINSGIPASVFALPAVPAGGAQ